MATEIRMPALAPSMTEGHLVRWVKAEGDAVKAGEIIAEVETDKALVDLEAGADGVLGPILVAAGTEGVKVDSVIALLLQPGEALPALAVLAPPPAATAAAPTVKAPPAASPAAAADPGDGRIFASPLARRLAEEQGVALAGLRGSGPHGRIVSIDVEAARRPSTTAAPAAAALAAGGHDDIPHSAVRRLIAQRLTAAKQQVPHFYLTIDCRIDRLLALRAEANAALPDGRLSVTDFVVRAAALALRRVPAANASWTDTAIRRWRDVDVAVAVATTAGLITPIVRTADAKTVSTISAELKALAARAREGRLPPGDYEGGGFTISNLGMYGIREFAAIVNPPQACILAVGAGEQRAVVSDGALAVATVMTCTLSVDHRAVDGAVGAEFLAAFKSLVEQPVALLV